MVFIPLHQKQLLVIIKRMYKSIESSNNDLELLQRSISIDKQQITN